MPEHIHPCPRPGASAQNGAQKQRPLRYAPQMLSRSALILPHQEKSYEIHHQTIHNHPAPILFFFLYQNKRSLFFNQKNILPALFSVQTVRFSYLKTLRKEKMTPFSDATFPLFIPLLYFFRDALSSRTTILSRYRWRNKNRKSVLPSEAVQIHEYSALRIKTA